MHAQCMRIINQAEMHRTDSRVRIRPLAAAHVERVADEVALAAQTPHGVQRVVRRHVEAAVAGQVREQPELEQEGARDGRACERP